MGYFKDILIETRNMAQEMRRRSDNDCLERVQTACQVWHLDQMIKIAGGIEHICHKLKQKQK